MKPFVADPDFTLYVGDVRDVLSELAAESVDCVVTSPPYWGLRDYGTGEWQGGDVNCDHAAPPAGGTKKSTLGMAHQPNGLTDEAIRDQVQRRSLYRDLCGKCGATRVDRQLGLEATPEAFVEQMVEVFRQVRRVLAPHGTLWLNLGDSYGAKTRGSDAGWDKSRISNPGTVQKAQAASLRKTGERHRGAAGGVKEKDLVGIPWRVAFALQADGWYLRSDIIWSKPNPMPESVSDRPTKAHEYVFLLTKSRRYFFDQDAVREPYRYDRRKLTTISGSSPGEGAHANYANREGAERWPGMRPQTRRALDLFEQAGLTDEHLVAIRAVGITDTDRRRASSTGAGSNDPEKQRLADEARAVLGSYYTEFLLPTAGRNLRSVWEIATQPYADAHFATFPEALPERCIKGGCPAGGIVLDPFMGSGTTALVARRLGRRTIGIELNPEYAALCARRLQQLSLLADSEAAA